ncbi:MAG: FadR/GntR family transcriptional regulator [Acuticoccus sp.]
MSKKVYQHIAEELAAQLDAGLFQPGEKLPTERELAASLRVSRTSLREALLALEFNGRIEIRDRAGIFVRPQPAPAEPAFGGDSPPGPYEVLEARRLIEGDLTYRACLRASDADLDAIVAAADAMNRIDIDDLATFLSIDRSFHLLIAQAGGNSVLADVATSLWDQRDGPLWTTWYQGTRSSENRRRSARQHAEIATFIKARQASAARAAMERHIDTIIERFLRYGTEATEAAAAASAP